MRRLIFNSPFTSCSKPLFQTEAKRKAIDRRMILYSRANKIHFHKKGFPLSLALKVRGYETRKCLIFLTTATITAYLHLNLFFRCSHHLQ